MDSWETNTSSPLLHYCNIECSQLHNNSMAWWTSYSTIHHFCPTIVNHMYFDAIDVWQHILEARGLYKKSTDWSINKKCNCLCLLILVITFLLRSLHVPILNTFLAFTPVKKYVPTWISRLFRWLDLFANQNPIALKVQQHAGDVSTKKNNFCNIPLPGEKKTCKFFDLWKRTHDTHHLPIYGHITRQFRWVWMLWIGSNWSWMSILLQAKTNPWKAWRISNFF